MMKMKINNNKTNNNNNNKRKIKLIKKMMTMIIKIPYIIIKFLVSSQHTGQKK